MLHPLVNFLTLNSISPKPFARAGSGNGGCIYLVYIYNHISHKRIIRIVLLQGACNEHLP